MTEFFTSAWAVRWDSRNQLDGHRAHLIGTPDHPCRKMLFATRAAARAYIAARYGYIRERPDLRAEPYGWRMPRPVRVTVSVVEQSR